MQATAEHRRRLVHLDMADGSKQLLEADLVLWTAGSQPASSPQASLKARLPLTPPSCAAVRSCPTCWTCGLR